MAEGPVGIGADWAIAGIRFRAIAGRELPKVKGGYRVEAVDELRDDALAFVADWDAQVSAVMHAAAEQIDTLNERVDRTETALEDVTRHLLAVERERDDALATAARLDAELVELKNRPDVFDEAGAQIAVVLREASTASHQLREAIEADVAAVKAQAEADRANASAQADVTRQQADLYAVDTRRSADEHAADVRRTADEHAADIRRAVEEYAEELRQLGRRDAAALRDDAAKEADAIRQEAFADAQRIRAEAEAQVTATLDEATELERDSRRQAEELLEVARREASALLEAARDHIDRLEAVELELSVDVDLDDGDALITRSA